MFLVMKGRKRARWFFCAWTDFSLSRLPRPSRDWCLIRFAKLSNLDDCLTDLWKTELKAASKKIEGNNSFQARTKAISEVWVTEKEYSTDANVIDLTINVKFREEGLDVGSIAYAQTIQECMVASNDIIQTIASESSDSITQYVNSL